MKQSDKKKKQLAGTLSATVILILVALLLVFAGYTYLAIKNNYTFDDLIDNIVGNLIGVLAAFLLFDILYNKLTQDAYARETSQQITKTLMGEPEILNSFSGEDKKNFIKSTIASMLKDEDAVDMITANLEKYFDRAGAIRIRTMFDYIINLEPALTQEYLDYGFPGAKEGKYYLIDEELKFRMKYLGKKAENFTDDVVRIGFAYDKKSLDAGLLETGKDADFTKSIFNEDLVIESEAIEFINQIPADKIKDVIQDLFMPILRIDNSEDDKDNDLIEVERKPNGLVLKFRIDYDHSEDINEHLVTLYFKMPRLWDTIFEVTLVDPTREPHIKLKYKTNGMDVTMYSYLNRENQANAGACIQRAGVYDIAIKDEWIYPKSGVIFSIRKAVRESKRGGRDAATTFEEKK